MTPIYCYRRVPWIYTPCPEKSQQFSPHNFNTCGHSFVRNFWQEPSRGLILLRK